MNKPIGVRYVEDSGNSKIAGTSKCDAVYVSIEKSCPNSCPLKTSKECYAATGYTGLTNNRLDKEAKELSSLQIARQEAKAINQSYHGKTIPHRDLRLHVSGDSRTIKGTKLINAAVGKWLKRGGNKCWSYTHAWKHVPRKIWNNVSILASITSIKEVDKAREMGYAPALIVEEHPSEKSFTLAGSDIKWIPCPAQTRNVPCVSCRLCFDSERLFNNNFGIAFAAHGVKKNSIKRHLKVLNG